MRCEDFPCCGHDADGGCAPAPWQRTRRPRRTALTPLPELVGRRVAYTPKDARGRRTTRQVVTVTGWDPDTRLLTVEQSKPVSPWSPEPTRTTRVPLHHGPFTPVS